MRLMFPCFASFLLTSVLTPLVIRCAKACNCLDAPGGRRLHRNPTPRWGGVAFFAGVLPFLVGGNSDGGLTWYLLACLLLVGMGAFDDLKELGWKAKAAGITTAATMVIFGGKLVIHHVGSYGPLGRVELGGLSIPFTYLCLVGITNAINLLDGLNGLAGGVSLLGFLFMGIAAALAGNLTVALVCLSFVGALSAFLIFNFPRARIFMGDSGSLVLGFSLSSMAVYLTQGEGSPVGAMFPVLVLLIPIFDTLRVMYLRLRNRKNPFRADHSHLHYLLVVHDVSSVNVSLLYWALTALLGVTALVLGGASAPCLSVVANTAVLLGLLASRLTQKGEPEKEAASYRGAEPETAPHFDHNTTGIAPSGEIMTLKWIVVVGVILLATRAFAGDMPSLRTDLEKQSYGLGVEMGKNLKRQGSSQMDPELILKGLKEALRGDKLLMTDDELKATMRKFAAERRARQKEQEQAGAVRKDAGEGADPETLQAIGQAILEQIAVFNLNGDELDQVEAGISAAYTAKKPKFDMAAFSPKIQDLAQARRKARGMQAAETGRAFLEQAAREQGAVKTGSGVVYRSFQEGEGASPGLSDTVKVNYRGTLPGGQEFGRSKEPVELVAQGSIKCWQEALPLMKPGGKARIVCPAETAYGEKGAGELILPYATLVFEVELLGVKQAGAKK